MMAPWSKIGELPWCSEMEGLSALFRKFSIKYPAY